jgi:magnesium transporter
MPPTLIASLYGMNFKHMPELEWQYGYLFAIAVMVLAAALPRDESGTPLNGRSLPLVQ